jgi:hypothetical protein
MLSDNELRVFLVRRTARLSKQVVTYGTMFSTAHKWYQLARKCALKRGWKDVYSQLQAVWLTPEQERHYGLS